MPRSTPVIKYSLKNRGREHTGKPRNFNVNALFDFVNGPACQETVNSRGMIGYYGHWPRIRFGMIPTEGGLDENGRPVSVEPAFVTTKLSMTIDGTVEHVAEFSDTDSGKLAEKLFFDNDLGGFSSAINENTNEFFGFDYVVQPNFLGNSFRGISLDDAMGGDLSELTYDDVYAAEQQEYLRDMRLLLDGIAGERETFNQTIEQLKQDNDQLLAYLARYDIPVSDVLDSADDKKPVLVSLDSVRMIEKDMHDFESAKLPKVHKPGDIVVDRYYDRLVGGILRR